MASPSEISDELDALASPLDSGVATPERLCTIANRAYCAAFRVLCDLLNIDPAQRGAHEMLRTEVLAVGHFQNPTIRLARLYVNDLYRTRVDADYGWHDRKRTVTAMRARLALHQARQILEAAR
ncbi:MAG: hypothetical protein FJX46_16095 [Alphaproteobacteria bacterium]|nr:hypothetical protein [Alphaproteobacteria bacterium]